MYKKYKYVCDYEEAIKRESELVLQLTSCAVVVGILALFLLPFSNFLGITFICFAAALAALAVRRNNIKKHIQIDLDNFKIVEEQERRRNEQIIKEKIANAKTQFTKQLNDIPKFKITISDKKIPNKAVKNMPEIKIYSLHRNTPRQKLADFVVIDIETTGLKLTSSIVEVSAIRFVNFKPAEAFTTLINPQKPIPAEATAINRITNSMVENAPTFKSIIPDLEKFIGNSNLLGQNLYFDLKFLYKYGYDFTTDDRLYFDTLSLARDKIDKDYISNYKLDTLCQYYHIYRKESHRALSDCLATGQLFIKMLKEEYDINV